MVNEHPPHDSRGERKKMRSVFPVDLVLIDQPQKSFVHQGRPLQRMSLTLHPEVMRRHRAQLLVDQWQEGSQRRLIPGAPVEEQACNSSVGMTLHSRCTV